MKSNLHENYLALFCNISKCKYKISSLNNKIPESIMILQKNTFSKDKINLIFMSKTRSHVVNIHFETT